MRDDGFCEFVLDQLRGLGAIRLQRLFGGHGLYRNESIFGIVYQGSLYFKTDALSSARYTASGMQPLAPSPRQTLKDYYQVPVDVIEDADQLVEWGAEAIRCGGQ